MPRLFFCHLRRRLFTRMRFYPKRRIERTSVRPRNFHRHARLAGCALRGGERDRWPRILSAT